MRSDPDQALAPLLTFVLLFTATLATPASPSASPGNKASAPRLSARDIEARRLHLPTSTTSQSTLPTRRPTPTSRRPRPEVLGCAGWTTVAPNTPSFVRVGIRPIYDPVRDRMIVAGGFDEIETNIQGVLVCSLAGTPAWSTLTVTGTPPPILYEAAAVYDPVRDRVLYIGGWPTPGGDYPAQIDVWSLSLSGTPTWSHLTTAGSGPAGRSQSVAIYDPSRDRVVFGGGRNLGGLTDAALWTLSLTGTPTWTPLTTAGTPPSDGLLTDAVYDAPRDRMVALGISTDFAYALTFSGMPTWTRLTTAGTAPTDRASGAVLLDAATNRLLVFGGAATDLSNFAMYNDVFALTLAGTPTWSQLNPGQPRPVTDYWPTAMIDPVRHRLISYGGFGPVMDEVWALSLGASPAWSQLAPTGGVPGGRNAHTTILDKPRNRLVVFGGSIGDRTVKNDVWVYDLAGSTGWTLLTPTGARPSPRQYHTAVFDSVRNRMVVFGGNDYSGNYFSDVWALSLTGTPAWTPLNPSGAGPSARANHGGVYDRARNRIVFYGGTDAATNSLTDVWALSLSSVNGSWSQLSPTGTGPLGNYDLIAGAYDPVRDRIVLAGSSSGEVWTLPMTTLAYSVLLPSGSVPMGHAQGLVYDPFADRMIADDLAGSWVLNLSGTPSASVMVGSHPDHSGGTIVFDTPRNRAVLCGGYWNLNDVMALSLNPSLRGLGTRILTWYREFAEPEGGSIQIDPAQGCYSNGATVTLTATALTGYSFGGWDGAPTGSGSSNPLVLTMDSDRFLTANFVQPGVIGIDCAPNAAPDSGDAHLVFSGFNFGPDTRVRVYGPGPEELTTNVTFYSSDGRELRADVAMWDAPAGGYTVAVNDKIHGVEAGPGLAVSATFHVTDMYPAGARNGAPRQMLVRGRQFQPGAIPFLHRVGETDIVGTSVVVAPDGNSLTATFDFTNRTVGLWDLNVTNPGGPTAGRGNIFAVVDVNAVDPDAGSLKFAVAPNPVRGRMRLDFTLTRSGPVEASLFDLQGRRVAELVNSTFPPGQHQVSWSTPNHLASGLYFVVWRAEGQERRMRVAVTR